MIKIKVLNSLRKEIHKTFKAEAVKVYRLIKTLEGNPQKGKVLCAVGTTHVHELRFMGFRFYYIMDASEIRLYDQKQIEVLLIEFVRMSKKSNQQQVIDDIKAVLKKFGRSNF